MGPDTLQLPGWLPLAGVYPLQPDRCLGEFTFRAFGVRLRVRVEPRAGSLTVTADPDDSRLVLEAGPLLRLFGGPPGLARTVRRWWPRATRTGGLRLDIIELDGEPDGRLHLTAELQLDLMMVPLELDGRVVRHNDSGWTFVADGRVRLRDTCWKYAPRLRRMALSRWIHVLVAAEFAL